MAMPHSLGDFELLVLLSALRQGDDEAYTVSIAADIGAQTGRTIRRANVYTTLQRLERKGLVSTRLGDARAERGGRPRRLVCVTPEGLTAVRTSARAITSMLAGLDDVVEGLA